MEVLVYGGWFGSGNIGDEAILIGVRKLLEDHIPEARLTALSINPEYTEETCGVEAVRLESPRSIIKNRRRYFDLFKESDVCIVTGGTPFYDYGHLSRVIHMGLPSINQRKLICFGVGSKPITSLKGREITRRILGHSLKISARDRPSKEILLGVMRKRNDERPPRIDVTGDSALFLDPSIKGDGKGGIVYFCPRRLIEANKILYHEKIDSRVIARVRHMQAKAADWLSDIGYEVVFMPFHTVHPDNDLEEIRVIRNLMKSKSGVTPRPKSPEAALKQISESSLVAGMRLHSLVLAASCGIPFVSIDYDIKIRGFMSHMGLDKLVCSPGSGLNALVESADKAIEDHSLISRNIKTRVTQVRRLINRDAAGLSDTVKRFDQHSRTGHPLQGTRTR